MSTYCGGQWRDSISAASQTWEAWDVVDDEGSVALLTAHADEAEARLQDRFDALVSVWRSEVGVLSSTTKRIAHPAYAQIIALGEGAIPLLLRELQREPNHWFCALRTLTHADPVLAAQRGRMDEMANAWIEWGRDQGLIE